MQLTCTSFRVSFENTDSGGQSLYRDQSGKDVWAGLSFEVFQNAASSACRHRSNMGELLFVTILGKNGTVLEDACSGYRHVSYRRGTVSEEGLFMLSGRCR